jgi:hypothetical protein
LVQVVPFRPGARVLGIGSGTSRLTGPRPAALF